MSDPYRVLGVEPTADFAAIQAAYRRLMREHHPDRAGAGADADRAQAINAAFTLLKDPARRARLDAERRVHAPIRPSRAYEPPVFVRRRGPSLQARQRRIEEVRWVRRAMLAGACLLVGLGVVGAVLNYRPANAPWQTSAAEASEKLIADSRETLRDRLN
ncbi:J domain-containing protein [Brevundimonas sp.]|uniref:J domain-containing protein n=1 Tax=Brevundimonas sp. TaxID=1871086 RepID=UPI002FD9601F